MLYLGRSLRNMNKCSAEMKLICSRGGSRAAATSKMERFVIIVNGYQPLTIITKRSILDAAAALDPPLGRTLSLVTNFFIKQEKNDQTILHTQVALSFKKYVHISVSCTFIKKFKLK